MRVVDLRQFQRARQRVDRRDGGATAASLLEARQPIDADAREFGHLLASEARRAPAPARRQAGLFRGEPLAPRAQEIREFAPGAVHGFPQAGSANPRIIPGLVVARIRRQHGFVQKGLKP